MLKENSSVILSLLLGEIDPSKKPPPPEKRKYNPVGDWTLADGCPDGCSARIGNYNSLITHTPSPRITRILVPEKHSVMRKPC